MHKDFDNWNKEKKEIENKPAKVFCHAREIWWCSIGVNVGFEQNGTGEKFDRPIFIIKGFNEHLSFAVSLTGKKKTGTHYYYLGKIEERDSSVILSQAKLIDTKRLVKKIMTLDKTTFEEIKTKMKKVLFE